MDVVAKNAAQLDSEVDPFTPLRYRQFLRHLPQQTSDVLDVGCNTGRGGQVLKFLRPSLRIHALDLLQSRLDRLPKGVYESTICGSATSIPVPDESMDAIVAGEFIEHLLPLQTPDFLAEAFRVLRIGGRLLLTTPNPGDIKRKVRGGTILGKAHLSQHHSETLKMQLRMFGFGQVKICGSGKVSQYIGGWLPYLGLYGSYLSVAEKY